MFFVPDSTQRLVISGVYDAASVSSVILCPVVLYLLYLDRKRAAKMHTVFQAGIVCTSFLCDLLLGISNPVALLPYPAAFLVSPIYHAINMPLRFMQTIIAAYFVGEVFIIYLLASAVHHRLFLLKNREIQHSPIFIGFSIFTGIILCITFCLFQGVPLADAGTIDEGAIDEYGSGLYRLLTICIYSVLSVVFPNDHNLLDHTNARIPDEMQTFIKETSGAFYLVVNRSFLPYFAIFLLIIIILLAAEIGYTVLRIFNFMYKLGENIKSKQTRQTQIGYVRILLLQFLALILFYGLSFMAFLLSLAQDYVDLGFVGCIYLAYFSWHSTANCLILIFGAKSMRGLLFKKIKELWATYHKYHGEHSNDTGPIAGKAHPQGNLKVFAATTRVKPLTNNVHM